MSGGAWRRVSNDEYDRLKLEGVEVGWVEGAGCVAYDQQALDGFRSASAKIAEQHRLFSGTPPAPIAQPRPYLADDRSNWPKDGFINDYD